MSAGAPYAAVFTLSGKSWDLFLLVPGAVLGAILGLVATLWWQRLREAPHGDHNGSVASPSGSLESDEPPLGSSSAAATSTAASESTSAAAATVHIEQVINLPPPPRHGRRGGSAGSWLDDLEPWEALLVIVGVVVVVALLVAAAYAWTRPIIEGVYLVGGAISAGLCLTLLVATLLARVVEGARWAFLLAGATLIFTATAATPWVVHSAVYPFKDYDEVLRLIEARPFDISSLYGGLGVKFVLWQVIGVVVVGSAALLMVLVVVASALGVSSVLGSRVDATLVRFRRHPVGLTLVAGALVTAGLWITNGRAFKATESVAYEHDGQAPKMFELATSGTGTRRTLTFRADEPGRLTVNVKRARTKARGRDFDRNVGSGAGSVAFLVPLSRRDIVVVVTTRMTDLAMNAAPTRRIELRLPARTG